jgi:hypothetical protein
VFPVTITIHNANDLASVMLVLGANGIATIPVHTVKEVSAPDPKSAPAAAAVSATSKPTAGAVAAVAPATKPASSQPSTTTPGATAASAADAGEPELVYEAVAKAINAAVKSDRARVVAALAEFGAKKGTDLKPEQWAPFMAALGAS